MQQIDIVAMELLAAATSDICGSRDSKGLVMALEKSLKSLGFASFNLGCHKKSKYELALDPTITNWPKDFMGEYEGRNWAEHDPTLARAASADRPFGWTVRQVYADRKQQDYMEFLVTTPLRGGFSIPLPRRAGTISSISVECHSETQFDGWVPYAIGILANSAMVKAEALGLCDRISVDEAMKARKLSASQTEILKWVSDGKSNADIATILGLSERVVKYHMTEILRKLGVATRAQAVTALARDRGI